MILGGCFDKDPVAEDAEFRKLFVEFCKNGTGRKTYTCEVFEATGEIP